MDKNLTIFFDLFNYIGINIKPDSPPLLLFACSIFMLAVLCLISFITIILYIVVIYISEHKILLNKISDKPILLKFVNYYRNIRIIYFGLEVVFFL